MINNEYPFTFLDRSKRTYTETQKIKQYIKDGFIDRYSGERLVNPGLLKVISFYLPNDFPYHPHWKMDKCHNAYWELIPTLDHAYTSACWQLCRVFQRSKSGTRSQQEGLRKLLQLRI